MVSIYCSGILFFSAISCSLTNPFFNNTTRGILAVHWAIVNFLTSCSDFQSSTWGTKSLLVPLATISMMIEHSITVNRKEVVLSIRERVLVWCGLISLDVLFSLNSTMNFEISLLLFLCLVSVALVANWRHTPTPAMLTLQERISLCSVDMFADPQNIFSCLGTLGTWHFYSILATIISQVPFFNGVLLLRYLLYISRSVCTLSVLFTPAFFGGLIHSLKTLVAKLANRKNEMVRNMKPLIES